MHSTKQIKTNESAEEQTSDQSDPESVGRSSSIQSKFSADKVVQREVGSQGFSSSPIANNTGMPNRLKAGLENLSGYDLSSVRVHYNSSKPKQLGALAFAQGTNIHLGAGQERHLPHEGWHVVQQMQGRVKATMQMLGTSVNDDTGLEKEADLQGEKARGVGLSLNRSCFSMTSNTIGQNIQQPLVRENLQSECINPTIQKKQSHAQHFISKNMLGIESNHISVNAYIESTSNPKRLREGLLAAWNQKQVSIHRINTPVDLQATSTNFTSIGDLADWDSDDEDSLDLGKWKTHLTKGKVDLVRSGKTPNKSGVSEMEFFDAIRFGRQVNKRDKYQRLPVSVDLGGHHIEYNNPGSKDIYATPLSSVSSSASSKRKKFRRAGTSRDFNWKKLSQNLDRRKYKKRRNLQMQMMDFFLRKGATLELDSTIAEAIAAIGSDLMKGSKGGRFYIRRTLRRLQRSKCSPSFVKVFSGKKPWYNPASIGGRSLVSSMNDKIQIDANLLLGVNNCLINAVALAAGLPMPNLGMLMAIRERIGSYGEMLLATNETLRIIREVLEIQNPIAVVYQDRQSEDFAGSGDVLLIYHVGGDHFTDKKPSGFSTY
jgi:hypothetical protein